MVSQAALLQEWLRRNRISVGETERWLLLVPEGRESQVATIRLLNQIESRFDDLLAATDGGAIDWDLMREELSLMPRGRSPWADLGPQLRESLAVVGYDPARIARAERLWRDFLLVQEDQLSHLQVPAGWIAALDYLLQNLYFSAQATQEEIGRRHSVSASTVGLRFRALVESLDVRLFDHPSRKRLLAQRSIAVEGGQMSEAEFHQRLLRGKLALPVL